MSPQPRQFANAPLTHTGRMPVVRKMPARNHLGKFSNELQATLDNAIYKAEAYKRMYEAERSRNEGIAKRIRQADEEITRLKRENDLLKSEY